MKRENMCIACIQICMLSILLFGFVDSVFSKDFKAEEQSYRKSNQNLSDSVRTNQQSDSISVLSTGSCVNSFENQTVSSTVSVQGCNTLTVKNVTITNNGDLTLSAPENITLNGPFEVKLGGLLNIKNELTQWSINYGYDNAGNRIRRSASSME